MRLIPRNYEQELSKPPLKDVNSIAIGLGLDSATMQLQSLKSEVVQTRVYTDRITRITRIRVNPQSNS
ncbi:hypothetical protein L484_013761 [Morus notabilis]|uniref:Uncharacterized protein n=1 Tax=Morus notabilis TaxID=981085 RepID=W9QWH3_9ROSA|nr:hypothetical protein L484_013761 [Morus notabilis]